MFTGLNSAVTEMKRLMHEVDDDRFRIVVYSDTVSGRKDAKKTETISVRHPYTPAIYIKKKTPLVRGSLITVPAR